MVPLMRGEFQHRIEPHAEQTLLIQIVQLNDRVFEKLHGGTTLAVILHPLLIMLIVCIVRVVRSSAGKVS
jgi:hypothetical protein